MRSAIFAVVAAASLLTSAAGAQGTDIAPPAVRPRLEARRATGRITVDGRLDEADWRTAPSIERMTQVEPQLGAPSRYPATVRVLFDADNLYLGIFAGDSLGLAGVRVQDFKRDFDFGPNDFFAVTLDPTAAGKYNQAFQLTPWGTQKDLEAFDGGQDFNESWDALWRGQTVRTDSGWTAEMSIPWKSLRYVTDGRPWLMNFYRMARRTNEFSGWSPWGRAYSPHRTAYMGELVGLEPPPPSTNLRFRPYSIGEITSEGAGARFERPLGRVGGEVTWAPTPNAVLDLTANTDFAQADVDRQVVNLKRFSVFFPERRPFFQENATLFSPGLGAAFDQAFFIRPFFSRRIGLDTSGAPLPIDAGARFVYRGGVRTAAGMLVRQSGALDGTSGAATFGVARYEHNLGLAGKVGALVATRLDDPHAGAGARQSVVGSLDGFTRVSESLNVQGFVSMVRATGVGSGRDGYAAFARVANETSTQSWYLTAGVITKDYDPATGFVSRTDATMVRPVWRYDWRPGWRPEWLRGITTNLDNQAFWATSTGALTDAYADWSVGLNLQDGGTVTLGAVTTAQRPTSSFAPVTGVTVPAGTYDYARVGLTAQSDQSKPVSFGGSVVTGPYFDRQLLETSVTGRFSPGPRFAIEGTALRTAFTGNGPDVRAYLLQPLVRVGLTPRMNLSSFYQYNTDAGRGTLNVRYAWEWAPLSYLFIVYNDGTNFGNGLLDPTALPDRRQLVMKLSWMGQL
jgi:hypothetical protein